MNEVIKALYEIEEQAGELMEQANAYRQATQEEKKQKMEEIRAELEAEMEGRLTILKSRLEEQAQEEIHRNRAVRSKFNLMNCIRRISTSMPERLWKESQRCSLWQEVCWNTAVW